MCFICKNLQKSFKTIRSSYQDQYGIEKLIYLTNHTLYQTIKKFLRIYMYIIYIYIYIIYILYIHEMAAGRILGAVTLTYLFISVLSLVSRKKSYYMC